MEDLYLQGNNIIIILIDNNLINIIMKGHIKVLGLSNFDSYDLNVFLSRPLRYYYTLNYNDIYLNLIFIE